MWPARAAPVGVGAALRAALLLRRGFVTAGPVSLVRPRQAHLLLRGAAPLQLQPPAVAAAYATVTRRRRKELRRGAALARRQLLAFAAQFDPLRTARLQVAQTLHYLGWAFEGGAAARISSELAADFVLQEWYCAVEVVAGERFVLPGDPRASDDSGYGPGVRPAAPALPPAATAGAAAAAVAPAVAAGTAAAVAAPMAAPSFVHVPAASAFPSNVPEWLSPVRGLVLDVDMAARHAAIRSKGWKLVVLPHPLWEMAATRRHQHYARRDLLLSRVMPLAPFEARPVELQGGKGQGKSGGAAAKRVRATEATVAPLAAASAASGGAKAGAPDALAAARRDSERGRSRKVRSAARSAVSRAEEVAAEGH